MCKSVGVLLAYLSAYSPDLNPIEEAFAELKQWYRANHRLPEYGVDMKTFIQSGLDAIADQVKSHFSKARVGMPVRDGVDDDYWWD
jgi:hypothetical protein